MGTRLIAALAVLLLGPAPVLSAQPAEEKPSIVARFETPRDFGYHIGDLIPLTLVIEAATGTVVDLESLPHGGEAAGLFEVRHVRINQSHTTSGSVYRVEFGVQTFVPATWAEGVAFPPLELRFARPGDRLLDGGYVYRSVTLPPYVFFLSSTARSQEALRPGKGPVLPRVGWSFWGTVSLGTLSLLLGLLRLAGDLGRWWRRRAQETRSAAERRALRTLTVLRQRYLTCEEKAPVLFLKTSGVLRRFLREECGIAARLQTVSQIRERFRGHPLERELAEVLERCNHVTYDGHHPTPAEKEDILREAATLIGRFEETGCPVPGGNGAPR